MITYPDKDVRTPSISLVAVGHSIKCLVMLMANNWTSSWAFIFITDPSTKLTLAAISKSFVTTCIIFKMRNDWNGQWFCFKLTIHCIQCGLCLLDGMSCVGRRRGSFLVWRIGHHARSIHLGKRNQAPSNQHRDHQKRSQDWRKWAGSWGISRNRWSRVDNSEVLKCSNVKMLCNGNK